MVGCICGLIVDVRILIRRQVITALAEMKLVFVLGKYVWESPVLQISPDKMTLPPKGYS